MLIMMHKALHTLNDVVSIYVKIRRRGFSIIEDYMEVLKRELEDYIKKHDQRLITAVSNGPENIRINRTTNLVNKNEKKKCFMYISRHKISRPHSGRPRFCHEREKVKQNWSQHKTMPQGPIISKQKSIIRNRIVSFGYLETKTKKLIT